MNSTINLSFHYSESDYVHALRAHYASRLRLPLDFFVIVVLLGGGACLWRSPELRWLALASVALAVVFALILTAAFTVIPVLAFRREPKFRDEYSLEFAPEGIHFRTAHIDSRLQWNMYSRALITKHSYVLYYGWGQFTVIPSRVFQSAEQRQAFEKLLAESIPHADRRNS